MVIRAANRQLQPNYDAHDHFIKMVSGSLLYLLKGDIPDMKTVNKCVVCGNETRCMVTLSKDNEWLFKKKKVPMCIDCFCDLLDHKYYTHEDGETSYLYEEKNV